MIRKLIAADAPEVAALITESIAYADQQATGGLAFPSGLTREWTASDVLAMSAHFDTSWAYVENRRLMAVVIGTIEEHRGQNWYRIIIGATRISEIAPTEHEAYLSMPLREALPDARGRFNVTGTHLLYAPEHERLDTYMRSWELADAETVRTRGEIVEVFLPMKDGVPEIVEKSRVLEGRDRLTIRR